MEKEFNSLFELKQFKKLLGQNDWSSKMIDKN